MALFSYSVKFHSLAFQVGNFHLVWIYFMYIINIIFLSWQEYFHSDMICFHNMLMLIESLHISRKFQSV